MGNQKSTVASVVTVDARKFLRMINESTQARLCFFERFIKRLGEKQGSRWQLVALHPTELVFEDVDRNTYHRADVRREKGGKLYIENIQRVNVVEERKEEVFNKFCHELVDALAEENMHRAELAFSKIESCRFRPNVIPPSGVVRTRDERVHRIPVVNETIGSDGKRKLIECAVQALKSDVQLKDGRVVSAVVTESEKTEQVVLPIDELTRRRVVARTMKTVATDAYKAEPFQEHVMEMAGLLSEDRLDEAVRRTAEYLKEYQEFALLTQEETNILIENTLAATGFFNHELAADVAQTFHRTNLAVNHQTILEAWHKTALKAEFAPLLEAVKTLKESKDFVHDYDLFLEHVFKEDTDVRDVRRLSYLNSMKLIRNLAKPEDPTVQEQLDELINRLDDPQVDDAAMREAEDLLASISDELIQATASLEDFDTIPGEEGEEEERGEEELPPGGEEMPPFPGEETPEAEEGETAAELEDKQVTAVPITEMDEKQLSEEVKSWEENHSAYMEEDGFSDCMTQLNLYVERAEALGHEDVAGRFRKIRDQYAQGLMEAKNAPYFSKKMKKLDVKPSLDYTKTGRQYPSGKAAVAAEKEKKTNDHPLNKQKGSIGPGKPIKKGKGIVGNKLAKLVEGMEEEDNVTETTGTAGVVAGAEEQLPIPEAKKKAYVCECGAEELSEDDEILCPKCGRKMLPKEQDNQPNQPNQPVTEPKQEVEEDQIKGPKIKPLGMMRSSVNPVNVNKFEGKEVDGEPMLEGVGSDSDIQATIDGILAEMQEQGQVTGGDVTIPSAEISEDDVVGKEEKKEEKEEKEKEKKEEGKVADKGDENPDKPGKQVTIAGKEVTFTKEDFESNA